MGDNWVYQPILTFVANGNSWTAKQGEPYWILVRNKTEYNKLAKQYGSHLLEWSTMNENLTLTLEEESIYGYTCTISAPEGKYLAVLNTSMLLELVKYTNFIDGMCQSGVMLMRKNGNLCAIAKTMPSYQEAMSVIKKKQQLSKSKTTKWEPGHNYLTAHEDNIYVGKYISPLVLDLSRESRQNIIGVDIDFNRKRHLIIPNPHKSGTPLINICKMYSTVSPGDLIASAEKCPARQQGTDVYPINDSFQEELSDHAAIKYEENMKLDYMDVTSFILALMQTHDGKYTQRQIDTIDNVISIRHQKPPHICSYEIAYKNEHHTLQSDEEFLLFLKQIMKERS